MITVAVYELDQAYGGPEEGGWWYDTGTLKRIVRTFETTQRARTFCRRYNEALAYKREMDPWRRALSSVAYTGGHYEAQVWEDSPPIDFPEHRPYYC